MKVMAVRAIVIALLLTFAASCLAQGLMSVTGEAAEIAARQMEERLKENGLAMSKKDVERLEGYYQHVTLLTELRKQLTMKERAAKAAGLTKEANALAAERKAMDVIWKQLPAEPEKGASKNLPGFWQQLQEYQRQRQKGNAARIAKAEKALNAAQSAIDKQAAGGNAGSSGSVPGQWAVIVSGAGPFSDAPGSVRFYINGQEVTRNGQEIKVQKGKPILVRAVGIDARRSMIRGFQETAATSLKGEATDYGISYETKSGSFTGSTTFAMKSEEYSWSVSLSGDRDADYDISDSKLKIGLKQDLAAIKYGNQITAKITVSMKVAWGSSSIRPAGRRNSEENGSAKGSITLKVLPD